MRRLNLHVGECARLPAELEDAEIENLGEVYPEPFPARMPMWAFSARVLGALAEHAWQPTQDSSQLNVVLTPALGEGETRVGKDHGWYRQVFVGLPRARWLSATIADKRRILIETFVDQLARFRAAWSIDWPALQRAATEAIESYQTLAGPVGDPSPVALGAELAGQLEVGRWRETAPAERLAIGRAVAETSRG